MEKQNIIHIFGNNSFLVDREKHGLVLNFQKKYGKENIELCPIDQESTGNENIWKEYRNNISTLGFFQEKRLFIFYSAKISSWKKKGKTKKGKEADTVTPFLEEIQKNLSDEDFLIFVHINSEETELLGFLEKYATKREKNFSWKSKDWEKYTPLSETNIQRVLRYYADAEKLRDKGDENPFLWHAIIHTMNHLAALEEQHIITDDMLADFSEAYAGAKIFDLIDAIMIGNIRKSLVILEKIAENMDNNPNIFFSGFMTLIRQWVFVIRLREIGKTKKEIGTMTWLHPFVIEKHFKSPLSSKKISHFYQKLIASSVAYKKGNWLEKVKLWQILDIQLALLVLKK